MTIISTIFSYIRRHVFIVSAIIIVVIVVAIIASRANAPKEDTASNSSLTKVTLVNAATFKTGDINVSANGTVESHSQADIKSQLSAPVSVINVSIGDMVRRGQVLLELENGDLRAQLAQSEATLAGAEGQQYTGSVSLGSAQQSVIEKIRDSYNKSYDVVNAQIDPILYNNNGNGGRLESYIVDYTLTDKIRTADMDLKGGFQSWKAIVDSLSSTTSSATIQSAISLSQKNLNSTNLLLGNISKALNDFGRSAPPDLTTSVNNWKNTVTTSQASISGAAQALTTAAMTYQTSSASQSTSVPASVSAARAGVSNLQAQLNKTIITSPISGKVSSLPLRSGELATSGTLLATVVGDESNLEVKTFVSGEDLPRIKVGQSATIQSGIKGVVSNVSPSVDSTTKKAEVDIDVVDSIHSGFVVGQNVSTTITTNGNNPTQSGVTSSGQQIIKYLLPIQDVKIIAGDSFVYTVENSKIKQNKVTLGQIQGDFIEITSGLSDSMNIVTPIYGLDEGQAVQAR